MSNAELVRCPITVGPIGRQHGPEPESNMKSPTIELGSAPIREHDVRLIPKLGISLVAECKNNWYLFPEC